MSSFSTTTIALAGGALAVLVSYVVFIVAPAWASYGRLWERVGASLLTLYILATMVGIGAAAGYGVVKAYEYWIS
jgi:hypothetical protein